MTDVAAQCQALRDGIGYCDLSGRTQIELVGADRAKVLHGLCTNDIKRLAPGDGCEAFLTNVQGKTIGYINVFCADQSLWIDTAPGLANELIPAIDRYIIREDVRLVDRTSQWGVLLVSGAGAASRIASDFVGPILTSRIGIGTGNIANVQVQLRRLPYVSPECFMICGDAAQVEGLAAWWQQVGGVACSPAAVETARIEMGVPIYGQDVTSENLPQELARDEFAISFTKGCYLGQETVARIDALGHVNRRLVGLKFAGANVPAAGTVLEVAGKTVAKITSACFSPRLAAPLALAFVRRGSDTPGAVIASPQGDAEVVRLPIA